MKIGIDIRTLMDRKYSGVAEHTLNLVREILKLDQKMNINYCIHTKKLNNQHMLVITLPGLRLGEMNPDQLELCIRNNMEYVVTMPEHKRKI